MLSPTSLSPIVSSCQPPPITALKSSCLKSNFLFLPNLLFLSTTLFLLTPRLSPTLKLSNYFRMCLKSIHCLLLLPKFLAPLSWRQKLFDHTFSFSPWLKAACDTTLGSTQTEFCSAVALLVYILPKVIRLQLCVNHDTPLLKHLLWLSVSTWTPWLYPPQSGWKSLSLFWTPTHQVVFSILCHSNLRIIFPLKYLISDKLLLTRGITFKKTICCL